jgi:tRNA(fMet)-specific endonuclease VapC
MAMSDILIDTNAYVAFKRGDATALDIMQWADRIGIPTVVLGELLGGFAIGSKEAANRADLSSFLQIPAYTF